MHPHAFHKHTSTHQSTLPTICIIFKRVQWFQMLRSHHERIQRLLMFVYQKNAINTTNTVKLFHNIQSQRVIAHWTIQHWNWHIRLKMSRKSRAIGISSTNAITKHTQKWPKHELTFSTGWFYKLNVPIHCCLSAFKIKINPNGR